ncbi:A/G-specific DNA glycosylase [Candidatus Scalindua japonica]|uniref:A/G-specific DNA glycosylase n=1 Tax=Candidatus Scalindua japonica TaxID=1284222 RepID=A0A286TVV4_9BACT|nr:flagellar export chaperone FlgN [Candidatus Scalindua japonica]GAX60023.1 A/G-specific DNA glycosylase [Candidatus Scalindua japonica]
MEYPEKDNIKDTLSYLHAKKKYYEKILELSEIQEEVVLSKNIKKLSLITMEKENYIKEIKSLDRNNTKIVKELSTNNKSLILDKRINSLVNRLHTLVIKVRDYDLNSIAHIKSSLEITKTKLNKRRTAQQSMRYQPIQPSRYVDIIK